MVFTVKLAINKQELYLDQTSSNSLDQATNRNIKT